MELHILEDQKDKTWYIGFTKNLKKRLDAHRNKESPYTSKKSDWKLIYAELYIHKMDALGREKYLKSGAGHSFIRKQLKNYFGRLFK